MWLRRRPIVGLVSTPRRLSPLFGTKEARYDAIRFNWLGTPSFETAMVLLWHTGSVNSVQDLKTRETNMGASGANFDTGVLTRVSSTQHSAPA